MMTANTYIVNDNNSNARSVTKAPVRACACVQWSLLMLLFCLQQQLPSTTAYVVSSPMLPRHKQLAWLQDMTTTLIETTPGDLSDSQVQQSHRLLDAWSHLERPSHQHALQAEILLKRVVDERMAGNSLAQLNVKDYNCLLEGWARSGSGEAAAERCEQIVMEMQAHSIRPNVSSFKAILMAWRQCTNSPESCLRAQRILEYMVDLHQAQQLACPDADCFDICLQLWARSEHPDAPHRAEQLLGTMEQLYQAGHTSLKPRVTSFNAVLAAWSKNANIERAVLVLGFMEHLAATGETPGPDMVSYSTVISGLAKHPNGVRSAEILLKRLEEGYKNGNSKLEPDPMLYNAVLLAWSKSYVPGAYRRARSILSRQMQLSEQTGGNFRPDVYGFTTVLGSCATERKEMSKAFQVALATFQQLRHSDLYGAPNHVTYGTMLKCCAKLVAVNDPMRAKWVRKVFRQCVADGCVGDMVLSRLKEAADADLYAELIQEVDVFNLPTEWTRNVDEKRDAAIRKKKNRRTAEV